MTDQKLRQFYEVYALTVALDSMKVTSSGLLSAEKVALVTTKVDSIPDGLTDDDAIVVISQLFRESVDRFITEEATSE